MSPALARIIDQCKCKTVAGKIDLILSLHVRATLLFRAIIHYSESVAGDFAVVMNHNFSFAICYETGIRINVKIGGIIDRVTDIRFPIPVVNGLGMEMGYY